MDSNQQEEKIKKLLSRIFKRFEEERKFSVEWTFFRELREIVKGDKDAAAALPSLLQSLLVAKTCEPRQLALHLADYFYYRSSDFRVALNALFMEVLVLTVETDVLHFPLPLPRSAANDLKLFAMKTFRGWHEKFGDAYLPLQMAIKQLKSLKTLDFERSSIEMEAERKKREAAEKRLEEKRRAKSEKVLSQFAFYRSEMTRVLDEAKQLLLLLVPLHGFEGEDSGGKEDRRNTLSAAHGYAPSDSITVELTSSVPLVAVDATNEDVVQSAIDSTKMLNFHLNKLQKWLRDLAGFNDGQMVGELLRLKQNMEQEAAKLNDLGLERRGKRSSTTVDSDGEEDEFEDVSEKELEDFVMPDEVPNYVIEGIRRREEKGKVEDDDPKPGCSKWTQDDPKPGCTKWTQDDPKPGCSKWTQDQSAFNNNSAIPNESNIPCVSFGLDIKYWGEEGRGEVDVPVNNADCHRFWRPRDEGETMKEHPEVYSARMITFVGKEIRGERACRTPIKDGRLCQRMDVRRCPVHGMIIDRDEMGFPNEPVYVEGKESEKKDPNEEEEEYIRDVEREVETLF